MSMVDKNRSPQGSILKEKTKEIQAFSDRKYNKWSEQENFLYCSFLEENLNQFFPDRTRRSKNFFNRMSQYLEEERDNEQCRSHHQKMLKKYGTVEKIIENLRKSETRSLSSKEDEIQLKNTSILNAVPLDVNYQQDSNDSIGMFMVHSDQILYQDPFIQFFRSEELSFVQ